jgi:hypothetical protein
LNEPKKITRFSPKSIEDVRQSYLLKILYRSSADVKIKIEQVPRPKLIGTYNSDHKNTFFWSFSDLIKFQIGKARSNPHDYILETTEIDGGLVIYHLPNEGQE